MKNNILETIRNRRSCRRYSAKAIDEESLLSLLEAGNYAPSGHNEQPWHFTVINNKEIIDQLSIGIKKACSNHPLTFIQSMANNENFHVFYNAPTVIIISSLAHGITSVQDCSAAAQNILLAAESLGLGSCWIELIRLGFQNDSFRSELLSILNIPQGAEPLMSISIGFKDHQPPTPRRKNQPYYTIIR